MAKHKFMVKGASTSKKHGKKHGKRSRKRGGKRHSKK